MTSRNRVSLLRIHPLLAVGLLLVCPASAWTQTVVATVAASAHAIAVNPVTNKIYAAGGGGGRTPGQTTVIDGATNTTTVPAGVVPRAVAVNEVTNKVYVANFGNCTPFGDCTSQGSVTVIDGATNSATTVTDPNANGPESVAVNEATNEIYVANFLSGNVTVIDGATNATTTVTDPNANGLGAYAIAVNPGTSKVYVLNNNIDRPGSNPGNITVIDGATNSTTTLTDPNAITPFAVAVNLQTNKIYVANEGGYPGPNHGNVTVIDGATNSTATITDPNALAPQGVAVNTVTNKIYVANVNDSALSQNGGVTVIDGATNTFVTVKDPNAIGPIAAAVDPATNKIYVANAGSGSNPGCVTVIDGATNSVTTVIDPNASVPNAVAVDPATSMVYVANLLSGNVTVINETVVPSSVTLSVLTAGNGTGTVTSIPAGVNCPTSCSASFPSGSTVTLAASPDSGYVFSGWSGACSGTGACSPIMNGGEFVTATFNTPPPDFSLSPASTGLNVQLGGQVTDTITIAPQNGSFASAIQLSCAVSGPPPMPTCALSPASVTPGANSVTSTLTVTAPTTAAMLSPVSDPLLSKSLYALWLPLMLGITFVGRSKKLRRRYWVLGGLLLLLVFSQLACGGSPSSSVVQQPTNYTVTVTGASGTITHTTSVTVTLQ